MAEIKANEKYDSIVENRPIELSISHDIFFNRYVLKAKPMTMKYETFNKLGDSKVLPKVSRWSYTYENGECDFLAYSMDDIISWINENKSIVRLKKGE